MGLPSDVYKDLKNLIIASLIGVVLPLLALASGMEEIAKNEEARKVALVVVAFVDKNFY